MTLVLKGSIQNTFILIGDSLISGHERDVKIYLPTIGNIESIIPEDSGWSVRNLKKKIDVLENNIILGWHGNYQAASVVIGELRKINSVTPLSNITIGDFLSDKNIRSLVGDYIFDGDILGLTGFILEDKNVYSFDYASGKIQTQTINFSQTDNIKIYGSGAKDCYDYLTNNCKQVIKDFSTRENKEESVHRLFLEISSQFLTTEILSDHTITQYYGGYYDFAAFVEGKLLPKRDYTYFWWEVVPDSVGHPEIRLCSEGMKTRHLTPQITECLSWSADKSSQQINPSFHYISSVDAPKSEFKRESNLIGTASINFNSEYSCHFVVIRDLNGNPKKYSSFAYVAYGQPESAEHPVVIQNLGKSLYYNINKEFTDWIESQTRTMWGQ